MRLHRRVYRAHACIGLQAWHAGGMSDSRRFVIIGASLAGAKAAETLRKDGFDGPLTLVGDEGERPYERPPLSKEYLRGEAGPDKLFVHKEGYYDAAGIELRLGETVVAIDVDERAVVLASGERLAYTSLLLTTGSRPRRLRVPGAGLDGVHYLRSMASSATLRDAIKGASRVAVIGAGWIGCEVAASAREMGAPVVMVELGQEPLERVLGPEVGRFYRDLHSDHGVELHFGAETEALVGPGPVEGVRLADGRTLPADVVVVGVGVAPTTELAERAGIEVQNGVVTDEFLQTSSPGIFAAGDLANAFHPLFGERVRVEHWANARNQGPAAARNMLGKSRPFVRVPYFYSDQYDVSMEYSGYAPAWDEVVFRGDAASRQFMAFWLREGRVAAGMNVNIGDAAGKISDLVSSRRVVDTAKLADPDVSLADV
jgi:3-phenylpropionate/trans-cinnamate dioxygenase ferredoxin reductase component